MGLRSLHRRECGCRHLDTDPKASESREEAVRLRSYDLLLYARSTRTRRVIAIPQSKPIRPQILALKQRCASRAFFFLSIALHERDR